MKNKKSLIIILLILFVSIGYAILSTNLRIRALFEVVKGSFDVHFNNLIINEASITSSTPSVINNDELNINFTADLYKPGDFYEFTVDIVNDGTIDAMLDEIIIPEINTEFKDYIKLSVTYSNDYELERYQLLPSSSKLSLKVRLEYLYDVDKLLDSYTENEVNISLKYVQANDKAIPTIGREWDFDYTGREQVFNVLYDGNYKVEIWGAQGQDNPKCSSGRTTGGYGGYSVGNIKLVKNDNLYLSVGQAGKTRKVSFGGGGFGDLGGGGATHVAFSSGSLASLEDNINNILIVAGGGGGNDTIPSIIASGGGFKGNDGLSISSHILKGGSQLPSQEENDEIKGTFGLGGSASSPNNNDDYGGGGGGGFYGGSGSNGSGVGSGGSGYIGNSKLSDKIMYCYNCEESDEVDTRTISTTNVSDSPISNYAKQGNGYAKITYLGPTN